MQIDIYRKISLLSHNIRPCGKHPLDFEMFGYSRSVERTFHLITEVLSAIIQTTGVVKCGKKSHVKLSDLFLSALAIAGITMPVGKMPVVPASAIFLVSPERAGRSR